MAKNSEEPVVVFHGAKIGLKEGQKMRKIDISSIEALNRELLGTGSKIKELQDDIEELMENIEKNKADLSMGKIEKLTFNKTQDKFFREKIRIADDLRLTVRSDVDVISRLRILLEGNILE